MQKDISPEQRKALEDQLRKMSPEKVQKMIQEQCIFCKIIAGQVPAYKIYEDELVFAFLDIQPANKGHVLVIPKKHYQVLPQMPDQEAAYLFAVVKNLAGVVFEAIKPEGVEIRQRNGVAAGQEVPHVHIHIIPRQSGDKIPTGWEPKKLSEDEFKNIQKQIASALAGKMQEPKQAPQLAKQEQPKKASKKPEPKEKVRPRLP